MRHLWTCGRVDVWRRTRLLPLSAACKWRQTSNCAHRVPRACMLLILCSLSPGAELHRKVLIDHMDSRAGPLDIRSKQTNHCCYRLLGTQ